MMFEFCASAGCGISKEIATKFEETNNAVSILMAKFWTCLGFFTQTLLDTEKWTFSSTLHATDHLNRKSEMWDKNNAFVTNTTVCALFYP